MKVLNISDKNFLGVRNFLICSGNFFLKIKNKIIGSIIALKGVKTETSGAIGGLDQLKITYEEDAQFQAALNVAIETVTLTLELNEIALNDDDKSEHEL